VLIQGTLAEGLSVSRRVRWHARIDEALEELYGVDVEAHAAELAYHFTEAVTVSGLEKLVRYSVPSGEQALVTLPTRWKYCAESPQVRATGR
jgi:hypothetical protein